MPVMTETEFSVEPFADATLDADGETLDRILTALERDPSALGPSVGYDMERGRVSAIFQVEIEGEQPETATAVAAVAFDRALAEAGVSVKTTGVSVVVGSDPDLLP